MTVLAYVFPKLGTVKNVVSQMSKKPCFRTLFESQHAKGFQTQLKSLRKFYCQMFSSL